MMPRYFDPSSIRNPWPRSTNRSPMRVGECLGRPSSCAHVNYDLCCCSTERVTDLQSVPEFGADFGGLREMIRGRRDGILSDGKDEALAPDKNRYRNEYGAFRAKVPSFSHARTSSPDVHRFCFTGNLNLTSGIFCRLRGS